MSQLLCKRCGEDKPALDRPPLSTAEGSLVLESICSDCWQEWTEEEVRTINELRLNFIDPAAQETLRTRMLAYLNLAEAGTEAEALCDRDDAESNKAQP